MTTFNETVVAYHRWGTSYVKDMWEGTRDPIWKIGYENALELDQHYSNPNKYNNTVWNYNGKKEKPVYNWMDQDELDWLSD